MQSRKNVYLAGKITGDPYYKSKFNCAAITLELAGYVVVNPATLPADAFTWDAYIRMSTAMLNECAAVCFLPDWIESKGAMWEYGYAVAHDKEIIMYADTESERSNANVKKNNYQ